MSWKVLVQKRNGIVYTRARYETYAEAYEKCDRVKATTPFLKTWVEEDPTDTDVEFIVKPLDAPKRQAGQKR